MSYIDIIWMLFRWNNGWDVHPIIEDDFRGWI